MKKSEISNFYSVSKLDFQSAILVQLKWRKHRIVKLGFKHQNELYRMTLKALVDSPINLEYYTSCILRVNANLHFW